MPYLALILSNNAMIEGHYYRGYGVISMQGEKISSEVSGEKVPSKFAKSLLWLVSQRGYDTDSILASADISFDPLNSLHPGYQREISILQYSKLYQQVLSLLQDESFGLQPGKGVTPGAFRMMCYCIIHCENLGKAIHRACEFFRIFYEEPFHMSMEVKGGQATMGYPSVVGSEIEVNNLQAGDAYGLSAWHRFCSWLIGKNIEVIETRFKGEEPKNPQKYERLFNCPVLFNQAANGLIFDADYLDFPLVHTEQSLKEFLRTAPYQLMVLPEEADGDGLVARVKKLMGHDFSQGFPSFERISEGMNVSAPTLRRRLKKEGASYQQLKDSCRRDAAIAYLSRPELSINAVAALMGFTDPSAFHRSFKKWTGTPPGKFRQQQLSVDGVS